MANSKMVYAGRERENTPAKEQQSKAWATKAQQDWLVIVVIRGELYRYTKPAQRVDPYFQVFNIYSSYIKL
jgi:hypothetical protein